MPHQVDVPDLATARKRLETRWDTAQRTGAVGPGMCATDAADLDKACRADGDCSIVREVLDECRTTAHLGVSARGRAAFEARPSFDPCADGRCPLCNVQWNFAEDCGAVDSGTPLVSCVRGRCQTHLPE